MAEEKVKWVDTCDRYVAFLDIMGFKDRVYREKHEEVGLMLESLRPTVSDIEQTSKAYLSGTSKEIRKGFAKLMNSALIRIISFSDSIMLISNNDSDLSATMILYYVNNLLGESLIGGVPLKGAIAFGKQTANFDSSIHYGRPLVDAFELQNEIMLYGSVLHHSMEKRLIELNIINKFYIGEVLYKYPVPTKSGKIKHYLTDWTNNEKILNSLELINKMYCSVSGSPRVYVDNTLEFLDWLAKEKTKQKQEK